MLLSLFCQYLLCVLEDAPYRQAPFWCHYVQPYISNHPQLNVEILIPTVAIAFSSAHFGVGVGPIHLDNLDCSGSESKLIDCPRNFIVNCYRGHREDAGVRCQGRK